MGARRLFEPIVIGDVEVPNRIVDTTHGTGLGADRDVRYLQERARGGAGLIGVHSLGGVYGYALGPGPEVPAPDWDQKALHLLSDEGHVIGDALAPRRMIHATLEGARVGVAL